MIAPFLLFLVTMNQANQANVPAEERRVLMEFFTATGGERWLNHAGWGTSTSVCDWYGVRCDFIDADAKRPVVAGLSLALNNLEGTIPASLIELQNLRSLQLSGNHLSGIFPEALLERWDHYEFEFNGGGNVFSNMVVKAMIDYSASSVFCSEREDLRYRVEFDELKNIAIFQSVRCEAAGSRSTYCLVREGTAPSLSRFSRGIKALGFTKFRKKYDYPFSSATHGACLSTTAIWGDGSNTSVETYSEQGPIEAWSAQKLFLGLISQTDWIKEFRKARCDFQK